MRVNLMTLGLLALAMAATTTMAAEKKTSTATECSGESVYVYIGAPAGNTSYRAALAGKGLEVTIVTTEFGEDKLYHTYIVKGSLPIRPGVTVNNSADDAVVFTENGNASPPVNGQSDPDGDVLFNYLDMKGAITRSAAAEDNGFRMVWVEIPTNWQKGITATVEPRSRRSFLGGANYSRDFGYDPPSYPWKLSDMLTANIDSKGTAARVAVCAKGIRFWKVTADQIPDMTARR